MTTFKGRLNKLRRFMVPSMPHAVKTPTTNELVNFLEELAEAVDWLGEKIEELEGEED